MTTTTTTTWTARVRAPELRGSGGWLNTGGRDLSLGQLRGKIVVLDFWTFCCVNCLHVLDELRPLEDRRSDVLVVIGVHSPKFAHEADHAAVAAAVERYGVRHPVLDDPELHTWGQYAARAWPTLAVIDPEGYLVWSMAGEGHAEALDRIVAELVDVHTARGTLHRGDGPYVPPPPPDTALRYPGKVAVTPSGTLLVSDTTHHSLVELAPDAETVLRRIGSGARGRADGDPATAGFSEPQGVAVLPPDVAASAGYDVVVADTVNHLLRGVRLRDGHVTTVAGTGDPWRKPPTVDGALDVDLSSPWDVTWFDGRVIVAMAGVHQLWSFDPVRRTAGPWAGTGVESLRDGPVAEAWLAQPSGLAVDGDTLWFVDAESSALRWIADGVVHTAIGQGLFDFGHVDGPGDTALLQHPLGLAVLPDGSVAVCDTYDNAIRRYDPRTGLVTTLATDVAEPSGAVVVDGTLVVVESAAHRLSRPIAPGALRDGSGAGDVAGARHRTRRPVTDLAPGAVTLTVAYAPAPGQKLDESDGPATRLAVSAHPPELLLTGAGDGVTLSRELVLADGVEGVLQVTAQAASCDAEAANPACHLTRQDWGVPVRVIAGATSTLRLVLST